MTHRGTQGEELLPINGVELCVQTFGDPGDTAVLLIHGAAASMLWWEDDLCRRIAAAGRFVIRYDNRDTGRSTSYPVGRPGYALSDLAADAVGVLDALGIERAHVVGRSMAGGIALTLGVDHPDRVASLTFVTTTTGGADLPPPQLTGPSPAAPDFADLAAVTDHVVALMKTYSGGSPHFDEPTARALVEQDVARARDPGATLTNHYAMTFDGPVNGGFADITAPTLVVHGDRDPLFPVPHGEALRDAIPGAELLILNDTGHDVPRAVWDVFVAALVRHTS